MNVFNNLNKYNINFNKNFLGVNKLSQIVLKRTDTFSMNSQFKTNKMYYLSKFTELNSRLYRAYLVSRINNKFRFRFRFKQKKLKFTKKTFCITKSFLSKFKFFLFTYKNSLKFLSVLKKKRLATLIKYFFKTHNLQIKNLIKVILVYKNIISQVKLKILRNKSIKKLKYKNKRILRIKKNRTKFSRRKLNRLDLRGQEIVNTLKTKLKFQVTSLRLLYYSRVYFKYTGSNIFGTITNRKGEVIHSYSSGFFKGLATRREKTTIFVSQQLGELIAMRLYKLNAREVFFIPFLNHRKTRTLIKFMLRSFRFMRTFKFRGVFIKLKVMRNGVRLAKAPRK